MIVTVTPNASLDLTYLLPPGASGGGVDGMRENRFWRADSATLEASGKGVNVTRTLAHAGLPSVAVLAVGGATGQHLLDLLDGDEVRHRTIRQAGPTRVNTTILHPEFGTTKVNSPGSAPTPQEVDALVDLVDSTLRDVVAEIGPDDVWLAVCGSFPPHTDVGLMARLVLTARAAEVCCVVDSSGPALASAFTAGADLLAPNLEELAAVRPAVGAVLGRDAAAVDAAVAAVAADGDCELLVSLGADGAVWTDGRRLVRSAAAAVVPVNTAGAGDALLAGWLAGSGLDPQARLDRAVSWGTSAVLATTTVPHHLGTGPPG